MRWLLYFFTAFFVSLSFSGLIFWVKNRFKNPVFFRWGGAAMLVAFFLSFFLNPEIVLTGAIKSLLIALSAVLFFGLWDDWKNLSWKKQLAFQFFLAGIFLLGGFGIEVISLPWGGVWENPSWILGAVIFIGWLILMINSVNWLDGKDGLLGVLSFFGATSIFLVSLRPEVNQPALSILSIVFLGAVLGFWVFNFPPAKLEAGTSGSYFVGVMLAGLAFLAGTKIMTTLLILILPIMDAGRVIVERLWEGRSIFSREEKKRHLHYLLAQIGWSEKKIILAYGFFWLLALWPEFFLEDRLTKLLWLLGEVIVIGGFFLWVKKKFSQKSLSY